MRSTSDLEKLYGHRRKLAELVVHNEAFGPVFIRVEQEILSLEQDLAAKEANDVLARARAIVSRQKAMA